MIRKRKSQSNVTRLVDKELVQYINDKDLQYREVHLKTATKLSTMDFKSMSNTTRIGDFIGALVADFQHLVDYVNTKLSGDIHKLKGQSHISDMEDELLDIDRKIETVDGKITPLKGKFDDTAKKFKPEVSKWFYLYIPILIVIASMELIGNFDALNTLGGSRISSFGLAILSVISIYWYSHFTPDKVRKYAGDNVKKQVLLFFLFLIPIILVFGFFSTMRIQYMVAMNPELAQVYTTSPLVFTIINAFAYTISFWIIWAFKPSREVILKYKKYSNDVKELAELEAERESLCQERAALNPELRQKLTDRYQILLLGKQTEDEIVTKMRSCFEEFKMELFLKTNGACAPLFTGRIDDDLPKLKLNYQNIKPLNNN
jgi:predicted  nucleic acid-binding Zn-ribbon protein